jgi:5'-nucleotidase / UDP-sugar diphosphatase
VRIGAGGLLLGLIGCVSSAPPPIPFHPVRFLSINDVEVADTQPDGRGGLARVATVRQRLDDQGPITFVLAGNVLGSGSDSNNQGGRQMVDVLNQSKLDYATFGEREFELPADSLRARIAESKFKWLSSNCTQPNGRPLPGVQPWDTLRISGHKVGLFGLTLQGTYPGYVRCSNPDSAAHRTIETLSAEGVDLIVGVTHQSTTADRELLGRESKLNLVLGGHATAAQDSVVSSRHVVKADPNARSAQFVTLWGGGGKGSWSQAVGLVPIDGRIPRDTAVARAVAR